MADEEELNTTRKKIIEKHKNALDKEAGLAILTLALTIGFFGSSAVLAPDDGTPTGMFSGDLEIRSPVAESYKFVNKEVYQTGFSLVLDAEVRNPNLVEAELKNIVYQIKADGETIKRGIKPGSSALEAGESKYIATSYEVDFKGVSDTKRIINRLESGDREITVDGIYRFDVAGNIIELPFEKQTSLE